ncbi:hypothetical protein A9C19_06710 [Bacillus weihaiensis]|uniref:Uncharacterized protein n=1 Tax=Bacillus weihaiensis TaxID=1547283 RepID=A0A1L3MQD8_9BACI|nr:hypothetical protein A9C19_06710 [Bacillus weihaiensis]
MKINKKLAKKTAKKFHFLAVFLFFSFHLRNHYVKYKKRKIFRQNELLRKCQMAYVVEKQSILKENLIFLIFLKFFRKNKGNSVLMSK